MFYNLYEIGIIARDKTDIKDERTKLKTFLDSSNVYYKENKSYSRIIKMTRAITVSRNIDSKSVNSEILFLESLISKLSSRVIELKTIFDNLKKRNH